MQWTPGCYEEGTGPRKLFLYRNLETTAPGDGRIHIFMLQAIASIESIPGGIGWHRHTMRQFFWLTRGSAGLEVEGDEQVENLHTLDAAYIAEGQRHYAPRFSADFRVLQVSMPAEYDTFETDRPQ